MTHCQSNPLLRLISRLSLRPNKLTLIDLQASCKQIHHKLLWHRQQHSRLKLWQHYHNSRIHLLSKWHRQSLTPVSTLIHSDSSSLSTSRHHQNNKYNSYKSALLPVKWTLCQWMPLNNLRNKTSSKLSLELIKVSLRQQQMLQPL